MKYFVTYAYKKKGWFNTTLALGNAVVEVEAPMSLDKIREIEAELKKESFKGGTLVLQNFIPLEDANED